MLTKWPLINRLPRPLPKKLLPLTAAAAGGLLYLKVWLPYTHIGIPCPVYTVTGFYCPGCGITRMLLALLELEPAQALRFNALPFVLIPLYLLHWTTKRKGMKRTSSVVMGIMLALTLSYGVLRNFEVFYWLAPP
ncbi:DUF2752 domain-containing protein [Paenibacillus mesotrionivorans]|uniref:DUF2752 domain-containing protein n=1 Tax=Paenibacillus mesotrionivorans TaxID=3160968 RepID=A0ACC7NZC3_9BACL